MVTLLFVRRVPFLLSIDGLKFEREKITDDFFDFTNQIALC